MTAEVTALYGLRGANLEAFKAAGEIVEAGMAPQFDPRAESLLRSVRMLLTYAAHVEPIDKETAASFGARAANKLQLAVHMQDHA